MRDAGDALANVVVEVIDAGGANADQDLTSARNRRIHVLRARPTRASSRPIIGGYGMVSGMDLTDTLPIGVARRRLKMTDSSSGPACAPPEARALIPLVVAALVPLVGLGTKARSTRRCRDIATDGPTAAPNHTLSPGNLKRYADTQDAHEIRLRLCPIEILSHGDLD